MQQQPRQCTQSSSPHVESAADPSQPAVDVTTNPSSSASIDEPLPAVTACEEQSVIVRDLLAMNKPPKKKPGRHAKIVQLAYADEINRRLPQNLRFYRILPSTDSASFHIEKKSLSASDCSLVESVLGLRPGTCYVLWNWMKLKSITMSHSEWYKVAKNGKTGYVVQQSHLAYFQNTVLTTFEKEFALYLQQPTIKDVYFVKVREKRANQRGSAAQQRRARNILPASCAYPLSQLPSMEGIHFQPLQDDGFMMTPTDHLTTMYAHTYTDTTSDYIPRPLSPTSAYLNVVSVDSPSHCDTSRTMQYCVADDISPVAYAGQSCQSYANGYGQQQQQQLKVFTPVAVKSLSPIEGGLKLQQRLLDQQRDDAAAAVGDQFSCSPPAPERSAASPAQQAPRVQQPLCGRDVVLMRSRRRASEQSNQQAQGDRDAKRQKCSESAVTRSFNESSVHCDAP